MYLLHKRLTGPFPACTVNQTDIKKPTFPKSCLHIGSKLLPALNFTFNFKMNIEFIANNLITETEETPLRFYVLGRSIMPVVSQCCVVHVNLHFMDKMLGSPRPIPTFLQTILYT